MAELTDIERAYNASGEALEAAEKANERDKTPESMRSLQDAYDEFQRLEANIRAQDALKRFTPVAASLVGMSDHETRRYSLVKALRASMNAQTGHPNAWKEAGLELAASRATAEQLGREPQGFFIPMDVQQRTLTSGDATYAGDLIATDLIPNLIELYRNKIMVKAAGAQVWGGLVGNVAIPRQTAAATGYWVNALDTTVITGATTQTVDQVTMTPQVYGAYTEMTRALLLQASIDVENFVQNDLAAVIARGIDAAALYGRGHTTYFEPTGIAATGSVSAVSIGGNGGAPTWAKMVEMETAIATYNADVDKMAYMMNAKTRGTLKSTPKVATYSASMIWNDQAGNTPLNGYPVFVTNQCRSTLTQVSGTSLSEIFFGNWADLIIGNWGTLDILVNPYALDTSGGVRITALQDVDVAVRHPRSFSRMPDASCG